MRSSRVVITGMGVVSSLGLGREAFWEALIAGRSGIIPLTDRTDGEVVPRSPPFPEGMTIGGAVTDFDPKQWVRPRKALKVMCREVQTAFAAAQMAVDEAGLAEWLSPNGGTARDWDRIEPERVGTVFGSEMFYGPPEEMLDAFRECVGPDGSVDGSRFGGAAVRGIMPLWMLKYLPNMPACHVGIAVNAHGPNNTLVLGDISGPAAVMEARSCIQRGIADVIITGGVGTRINSTRLNYRGDTPIAEVVRPITTSCRPHDPQATGVIGGEGAASLVLESAELAARRNTRPLAEVVAAASRFYPSQAMREHDLSAELHANPPRGSERGVAAAVEAVLEQADLDPAAVGLIVSHAMGDPAIDAAERRGLAERFPDTPRTAPIPALGHCGAASGMLELFTGVAALVGRMIPPTLCGENAASGANLTAQAVPLRGHHVLCISHTSEGSCTAILLKSP